MPLPVYLNVTVTQEQVDLVGPLRVAGKTKAEVREITGFNETRIDACWRHYREQHNLPSVKPGGAKRR